MELINSTNIHWGLVDNTNKNKIPKQYDSQGHFFFFFGPCHKPKAMVSRSWQNQDKHTRYLKPIIKARAKLANW